MSKKRPWWSWLILDYKGFEEDRKKARDRRTLKRATKLRRMSNAQLRTYTRKRARGR